MQAGDKDPGLRLMMSGWKQLRKEKVVPIRQELGRWLEENYVEVLPKSPLGQAINYARARWTGQSAYTMRAVGDRQQPDGERGPPVGCGKKDLPLCRLL